MINLYLVINDINPLLYIGQTIKEIEDRFYNQHAKGKGGAPLLYQAILDIGIDHFQVIPMGNTPCPIEADAIEDSLIIELDTLDPNGYNSRLNGQNRNWKIGKTQDELDAIRHAQSVKLQEVNKNPDVRENKRIKMTEYNASLTAEERSRRTAKGWERATTAERESRCQAISLGRTNRSQQAREQHQKNINDAIQHFWNSLTDEERDDHNNKTIATRRHNKAKKVGQSLIFDDLYISDDSSEDG